MCEQALKDCECKDLNERRDSKCALQRVRKKN